MLPSFHHLVCDRHRGFHCRQIVAQPSIGVGAIAWVLGVQPVDVGRLLHRLSFPVVRWRSSTSNMLFHWPRLFSFYWVRWMFV